MAQVFCPALPNSLEARSVEVWCPAVQRLCGMKGAVVGAGGFERLRVEHCVFRVLGCPVLAEKSRRKGECLIGKELTTGHW